MLKFPSGDQQIAGSDGRGGTWVGGPSRKAEMDWRVVVLRMAGQSDETLLQLIVGSRLMRRDTLI